MGFNGTYLFCEVAADTTRAVVCEVVREFHERTGRYISDEALKDTDPHLLGVAVSMPVEGYVAIANTERSVDRALAELLASRTNAPVVISSIAEICDPPEPEHVQVFGAEPNPRFEALYHRLGFNYAHLVSCNATLMLFRFEEPFARGVSKASDDDIPF